nr:DNA-directed RNA polymerase I subunit like [Ipomoea batatas]GMD36485.1 DNA-directed RNA polymerase I subunit like [Ipomoea batatas]
MLAFAVSSTPIPPPPPSATVNHLSTTNFPSHGFKSRRLSLLKSPSLKLSPRRNLFAIYAAENGDGDVTSADNNGKGKRENGLNSNGGGGGGGKGNNGRPKLNLRWVDLLLDPDPENIVAVGLTGLLTWASVQILLQLFVISLAILIAALKYSFIAALLIFILITLL